MVQLRAQNLRAHTMQSPDHSFILTTEFNSDSSVPKMKKTFLTNRDYRDTSDDNKKPLKARKWLDRNKLKQMYQARQEELSLEQLNTRQKWRGELKDTIAAAKQLEHKLVTMTPNQESSLSSLEPSCRELAREPAREQ